jgi:energy-coupling factor transport system permease protein
VSGVRPGEATAERQPPRFHPLVWPIWLLAGTLAVSSNPLHNLLLLLGAALVTLVCQNDSPVGRAFGFFVRIGLVVIGLRLVLSLVAVGGFTYGATPLGRLPVVGLPWWLGGLALGGVFTLEMLASGIVGGVQLLTLLALFGAFNAVADHYGLLRRAPSFLGGIGLVLTIGLAFVPQTLGQLGAIRESQRVRGHHFRTWRDALPLLVPLISGGLERSLQLAEAMDSRGYGARRPGSGRTLVLEAAGSIVGLLLLALGLFATFYWTDGRLGWGLLGGGMGLLALVAQWAGHGTQRSRYLREPWRRRDLVAISGAVSLIALTTFARRYGVEVLVYAPLPKATLPPFRVWSLGMVVLLIIPAVLTTVASRQPARVAAAGGETAP